MDVEPVVTAGARLGEGPVWDPSARCLYWVDIQGRAIHRFDPATGRDHVQAVDGDVGVVVPVDPVVDAVENAGAQSGTTLLAAIDRRIVVVSGAFGAPDALTEDLVATLPTGDRANDGACDPDGRFLVGTLARGQERACALYRLDGRDELPVMVPDVTLSNGLDWSPDGTTFYYADTPTYRVDAFDYDRDTGTLSGRRTFVDLRDGPLRPDGLTVDAEGGVWVAIARGGEVRRFDPRGHLDAVLSFPTARVTSCAFGGDGLQDLYVTSGRFTMSETEIAAEPLAGALFRVRTGTRGKASPRWRDVR